MKKRTSKKGLTLLELLVVVFILSAIAFGAMATVNNIDEQFRFEDTRLRLSNIKIAVIGQPMKFVNDEPAVNGFAADMGRLPDNIEELIEAGTLPAWGFNAATGLWSGWRGPYLTVLNEQSGVKSFRDGWGNAGGAPNYGWMTFSAVNESLLVQSYGIDGIAGGIGYAADYPSAGAETLIVQSDHQLNLKGWANITIVLDNTTGSAPVNVNARSLRLRIYYPQNGDFTWTNCASPGFLWPATSGDRDSVFYLSLAFPETNQTVPANGSITLPNPIDFGSVNDKMVPWGVRSLGIVNDNDGCVYQAGAITNGNYRIVLAPRTQLPAVNIIWHVD